MTQTTPDSTNTSLAAAAFQRLSQYPLFLYNVIDLKRLKWTEGINPKHRRLCEVKPSGQETPATFVVIGRVATGQYRFKLLPEGELAGGGKSAEKKLAKVAATGELLQPDPLDKAGDILLRDSWQRVVENLQRITAGGRTKPTKQDEVIVFHGFNSNGAVKFKHKLFKERDSYDSDATMSDTAENDADDGAAITAKDYGPAFHIDEWPMPSAFSSEFEELKADNKYDVVPIPAYDKHVEPIEPAHYRSQLEGALVELHFTVEAWNFPAKENGSNPGPAKDIISAILTRMDVLDHKRPEHPQSPMRPRAKRQRTPASGPSKRQCGE